jgi:hypothetical protein
MSKSQSSSTDDLAEIFVSVTGDEEITEEQDEEDGDRDPRSGGGSPQRQP